jgi:hypothetical protein
MPVLLLLFFLTGAAIAGLDIDEYMPPIESDLTEEERDRRQEAVQRQIEEARRRAEEQARQEAEARRQREAERAARPYPLRLTEARCLGCHPMDALLERPRTRLGWELVALRMQRFNGAHLKPGERAVIARHLAETYPAPSQRKMAEAAILAVLVLAPASLGWLWWRRRNGSRSS